MYFFSDRHLLYILFKNMNIPIIWNKKDSTFEKILHFFVVLLFMLYDCNNKSQTSNWDFYGTLLKNWVVCILFSVQPLGSKRLALCKAGPLTKFDIAIKTRRPQPIPLAKLKVWGYYYYYNILIVSLIRKAKIRN